MNTPSLREFPPVTDDEKALRAYYERYVLPAMEARAERDHAAIVRWCVARQDCRIED